MKSSLFPSPPPSQLILIFYILPEYNYEAIQYGDERGLQLTPSL